jgi:serine/threonine protein kinase
MLLLDNADVLREKVAAATNKPLLSHFRREVATNGSDEVVVEHEACGPMVFRNGSMRLLTLVGLSHVHLPGHPVQSMLAAKASSADDARSLRSQVSVVQELHHRHVVEFAGCNSLSGFTILYHRPVMGPLAAMLARRDSSQAILASVSAPAPKLAEAAYAPLPAREQSKIALQVALGIEYLHANNVVHGCLSPKLVYVDARYNARVVAHMVQSTSGRAPVFAPTSVGAPLFGATATNDGSEGGTTRLASAGVSLRWQGPEAIMSQPITFASDVFAFGMVLWSLFETERAVPYYPAFKTDQAIIDHVHASEGCLPTLSSPFDRACAVESRISTNLADFGAVFEACTKTEPMERPAMSGVATLLLEVVEGSDRWEIDRSALVMVEKLGEGQFGDVLKMATTLFTEDGNVDFVAVKMLKVSSLAGATVSKAAAAKAEADFVAEMELMKRLRHPNLITLLGVCTSAPPFLAIIEFLNGGSLDSWLLNNGNKLFKSAPTKLFHMLHQIALGGQALARSGIVHRDLAARNVLVDHRLHVKVADYGLSRDVDEGRNYYRLATEKPMPVRWTAPEAVTSLTWTSASDVYSFGIVVFEMFTFGGFPFTDTYSDTDLMAILVGSQPIHPLLLGQVASVLAQHGHSMPLPVEELVQRCTVRDPSLRPTFDDLVHLTIRNARVTFRDGGVDGGADSGGNAADSEATMRCGDIADTVGAGMIGGSDVAGGSGAASSVAAAGITKNNYVGFGYVEVGADLESRL